MKKFGKVLAVLFAAIVLLGGCAFKGDIGMKISDDKKVSLSVTYAYDKELLDNLITMDGKVKEEDITDEMRWKAAEQEETDLADEGYTKTKYQAEGWYGYVYTKEVGTLDELSTETAPDKKVNLNDMDKLSESKLFIKDGNKYKSNMTYKNDSDDMKSLKQYNVGVEMTFTVELPEAATSNNAVEVLNDGKTLKWDLTQSSDIAFEFEFKEKKDPISKIIDIEKKDSNKNNTVIIIVCIVIIMVIVIIVSLIVILVVVLALKNKKK